MVNNGQLDAVKLCKEYDVAVNELQFPIVNGLVYCCGRSGLSKGRRTSFIVSCQSSSRHSHYHIVGVVGDLFY